MLTITRTIPLVALALLTALCLRPAPVTAIEAEQVSPEVEAADPAVLPAPTATGLPPVSGFTVNARIQPHGLPGAWRVEYGPNADYGRVTPDRALPGKLDAHFEEDWASGLNGWLAGMSGAQLTQHDSGGPDGGPFVRYRDDQEKGNDVNHVDGIGLIHLGPYVYPGNYYWAGSPPLYMGGGFPDLRGAKVTVDLRGVDWEANGTQLGTWIQGYRDRSVVEVLPLDSRFPNWAQTGAPQTDHLASGEWERAEWVLRNRTQDWTFAGANGGRLLYDYGELDSLLSGVNVDIFLLQILNVDPNHQPRGAFDTARLRLAYRQHSVCAASNGGSLVRQPKGGTGAERLTDGWRHGADREWRSQANPKSPQAFEYAFKNPIVVSSVNVHNAIANSSRDIEVEVSEDGGQSWIKIAEGTLPETHKMGPNYTFYHADAHVLENGVAVWAPLHPQAANRLRVTVLSGYQADRWALGEIEVFGSGAVEWTEDDWQDVNQDVRVDSGAWHYRVSVTTPAGTVVGPDQVVDVP